MSKEDKKDNTALGERIKQRRLELGLSITEAASIAGIARGTWSRYEAGASIQKGKRAGICEALAWKSIPGESDNDQRGYLSLSEQSEAWSSYLEEMYGDGAAMAFAEGSKRFYSLISEDMERLSQLPPGSCVGDLNTTSLLKILPRQFLSYYNYEFLSHMRNVLSEMQKAAKAGEPIIAHSVLQELILYLCNNEAMKSPDVIAACDDDPEEWLYEMLDDMDVVTFLFSGLKLTEDDPYHFSHWDEQQFYMD